MNKSTFTFIIGYRHRIDRFINLKKVLDWVNGFVGVDVILVEQDTHSKIEHLNLKTRHFFVKNDGQYNRSWGLNIGLKNSKSNIIVFSDSDIIMDHVEFIEAMKEIQNYDMVSPYKSVLDLNSSELGLSITDMMNIKRPGRGETDNQKINICGGMTIFRKESIQRIGGYPEAFEGWGGEDDFLTILVNNFLTHKVMDYRCYHLYHNREQPNMQFYQRNLHMLNSYARASKEELIKFINTNGNKIGTLNKYDV